MRGFARTLTMAVALIAATGAARADPPVLKFAYSYPPQVAAIPPLAAWFNQERDRLRASVTAQAAADKRDAAKSGRPFNPYETDRTWKVVADLPRFLSLSVQAYDYTGGAHGNSAFGTLVWDKAARQRLKSLSFFTSTDALRSALSPAFCQRLDAERKAKRGGDQGDVLNEFSQCIDPTKETVILGSSGGGKFNRIGILIAPYDAGPYAEGTYEVTLPVTGAVLAAVKPAWRGYFAVGTP